MKARLEAATVVHRGVILTSERPEEAKVLLSLWEAKGRPAMFARMEDGGFEVVIAPTEIADA